MIETNIELTSYQNVQPRMYFQPSGTIFTAYPERDVNVCPTFTACAFVAEVASRGGVSSNLPHSEYSVNEYENLS